jgi:hypothetical protein
VTSGYRVVGYAHGCETPGDRLAVAPVTVPDHVVRCMVLKKGLPGLRPSSPLLAMYLATVDCATSIPSLSSSPWMRGARHSRLARLISRLSRRISNGTFSRLPRERDFQRQPQARPMPSDDGLRLDNRQYSTPTETGDRGQTKSSRSATVSLGFEGTR